MMQQYKKIQENIISDEEQFYRFIKGDDSSIDPIYRKYYQDLYLYGQRFGADVFVVEETIQNLFLNLFKYRSSLKDINNIRSYIFRSFRNLLLRKLDTEHVFVLTKDTDIEEETGSDMDEEKIKQVKSLINNLSPREQEIILLKFYENYSNSEIAEILKIEYTTVRNLISRAFKKLRKLRKERSNYFSASYKSIGF